jgi:hypothetical protein
VVAGAAIQTLTACSGGDESPAATATTRAPDEPPTVAMRLALTDDGGDRLVLGEESGAETVMITVEPADFAFRCTGTPEQG